MNMPFCDVCPITHLCVPDLAHFLSTTGNKRIPPESYCKAQFEKHDVPFDDFYKKVLILSTDNVASLIQFYPELREEIEQTAAEEKAKLEHYYKENGIVPEHEPHQVYPNFYKERVRHRPVCARPTDDTEVNA